MRTLKNLLLVLILILIVIVAVANRDMASVQLLPAQLADVLNFNYQITLPLFVIILGSMLLGLLLGYFVEWFRERKHRRAVTVKERELTKLESEVQSLRKKTGEGQDDVLALLN